MSGPGSDALPLPQQPSPNKLFPVCCTQKSLPGETGQATQPAGQPPPGPQRPAAWTCAEAAAGLGHRGQCECPGAPQPQTRSPPALWDRRPGRVSLAACCSRAERCKLADHVAPAAAPHDCNRIPPAAAPAPRCLASGRASIFSFRSRLMAAASRMVSSGGACSREETIMLRPACSAMQRAVPRRTASQPRQCSMEPRPAAVQRHGGTLILHHLPASSRCTISPRARSPPPPAARHGRHAGSRAWPAGGAPPPAPAQWMNPRRTQ